MPRKYRVFDLYDNFGSIGEADTLEEAQSLADQWEQETDGECELLIQRWSETYQTYVLLKALF